MTHSTAEAEPVSYCEGLIAGKAAESVVKELTGEVIVEKVIYGDNLAAIGLANGATAASWRTRHLRIRASLLREALNDTDAVGWLGKWKLIHVKGLDLVADGLTKPLFGTAFQRFLENLGMSRPFLLPEGQESDAARLKSLRTREFTHSGAASALSCVMDYAVLSEAEALEEIGERDEADPLWIAAIVLMVLGAICAGKLAMMSTSCCLKPAVLHHCPRQVDLATQQLPAAMRRCRPPRCREHTGGPGLEVKFVDETNGFNLQKW